MICFDTNIIIYIVNDEFGSQLITKEPVTYASVTAIEALGYRDIRAVEERRIRELLATLIEAPLTLEVIESAIQLRQLKKMSLGDAIIAATALIDESVLWTANETDFLHVEGLQLYNPLKT
jgi:predicted nucleic acid-binding protein